MARKFDMIEPNGSLGPRLKKSVAMLLVRRNVAELDPQRPWTIRRKALKDQPHTLVRCTQVQKPVQLRLYEHHLEPKIEKLTIADSPWLRYLEGWAHE